MSKKPFIITGPNEECLLELDKWCKKWASIDPDAQIRSVHIELEVGDACYIECEFYAIK